MCAGILGSESSSQMKFSGVPRPVTKARRLNSYNRLSLTNLELEGEKKVTIERIRNPTASNEPIQKIVHRGCVIKGSLLEKQVIVLLHNFSRSSLLFLGHDLPSTRQSLQNNTVDPFSVRSPIDFRRGAMRILLAKSRSGHN